METSNQAIQEDSGQTPKQKPIVHYNGNMPSASANYNADYSKPETVIGYSACLFPLDHPNHLDGHHITNQNLVTTSPIVAYDPSTGTWETKNTIYVPDCRPWMQPIHISELYSVAWQAGLA